MFNMSTETLAQKDALHTTIEIKQQPDLWNETLTRYQSQQSAIEEFLEAIYEKHDQVRVVFTGAGTSAFIGETIQPYLSQRYRQTTTTIQTIPTTSIVSNPKAYLSEEVATILVSFARSGNSPESVATVELAKKVVNHLYQITITCNPEGQLAKNAEGDDRNISLLMPSKANDKGFAMTGAFTTMTLAALLVFDTDCSKETYASVLATLGKDVLERAATIGEIAHLPFTRLVCLGSGSLEGVSHEASLKILELTAGKIATFYESSLGFRHGPKSIIDEQTAVLVFQSTDPYTQQYDQDVRNEVYQDQITHHVFSVEQGEHSNFEGRHILIKPTQCQLPDVYIALPYIIVAQIIALYKAVNIGNGVDNPSPTGTVNRVVQGVTIHEYASSVE